MSNTSTKELLFCKYGVTLGYEQLAEVLHKTPRSVKNDYSTGALKIPTFKEGKNRLAHVQDVANYLDTRSQSASTL